MPISLLFSASPPSNPDRDYRSFTTIGRGALAHSHIARIQEAATSTNSGRGPFTRCLAVVSLALTAIQPPLFTRCAEQRGPFPPINRLRRLEMRNPRSGGRRPRRPTDPPLVRLYVRTLDRTVCARREIHNLPRDHFVFVRVDGLASSIARRSFSTMLSSPSVSVFLRLSLPLPRLDFD